MSEQEVSIWHKLAKIGIVGLVLGGIGYIPLVHTFSMDRFSDYLLVPVMVAAGMSFLNPIELWLDDPLQKTIMVKPWLAFRTASAIIASIQYLTYSGGFWAAFHPENAAPGLIIMAAGALAIAALMAMRLVGDLILLIAGGILFWALIGVFGTDDPVWQRLGYYGLAVASVWLIFGLVVSRQRTLERKRQRRAEEPLNQTPDA